MRIEKKQEASKKIDAPVEINTTSVTPDAHLKTVRVHAGYDEDACVVDQRCHSC